MALKEEESNLVLTSRELGKIIALTLVVMLSVFIAGYYLGKKGHSEELSEFVKRDAFADQIYSSLYALYGTASRVNEDEE